MIEDLPAELQRRTDEEQDSNWETDLETWAYQHLESAPNTPLLDVATPIFERIMISAALRKTGGRKRDAAELLGWGRNTLTRKMQELNFS